MKNLVILGGGYGGMRILNKLTDHHFPADIHVTLVDRIPYHCLKTEFYALAAGSISDHNIRVSFPQHERIQYKYGEVSTIDLSNKKVLLKDQEPLPYDELIIGLGCEDNYHNVPGAAEYTYSIQSIDKSRSTYQALNNLGPGKVVAIIGGGLSGIELASELIEGRPDLNIKLFDRNDHILSAFPKKLSNYVESWFHEHRVDLVPNSNITKIEPNLLYNGDVSIPCDAIVWTAGIQPVQPVRELPVEKDSGNKIKLTVQHTIPGYPDVFVIGDCASLGHAPSAQLAEGQGEQIYQVLVKKWAGEPLPESFPPIKLKGILGSLGKKHGFGLMSERTIITGRMARLLKSGVLWMYKYHNG